MHARILVLLCGVMVLALAVPAHDIWIAGQPDLFLAGPGTVVLQATVGGTFPQVEIAIPPERVPVSYVTGPDGRRSNLTWEVQKAWSETRLELARPGHYTAVLVQKPRFIEIPARDFNAYLEHEGLGHILEFRRQRGLADQAGREIYSRYVKALIHVGPGLPDQRAYTWTRKPLGLVIEVIPLADPCRVGTVPIEVRYRNQQLVNQTLLYGTHSRAFRRVTTDARGRAELVIDGPGLWFVKTIHMEYRGDNPAELEGHRAEWVSHWATLTFTVPATR